MVFLRVIIRRNADLSETQLRPAAGFFGQRKRHDGIMSLRPALRAPRLHDAFARRKFERDAGDIPAVTTERRAGLHANLRRFAGEL